MSTSCTPSNASRATHSGYLSEQGRGRERRRAQRASARVKKGKIGADLAVPTRQTRLWSVRSPSLHTVTAMHKPRCSHPEQASPRPELRERMLHAGFRAGDDGENVVMGSTKEW